MNFTGFYSFPANPEVTRAFELVKKGKREKAKEIIKAQGYEDPEQEVKLIELFIKFMEACNASEKRFHKKFRGLRHGCNEGCRAGRLRGAHRSH